jgi:GNAT superfamily N-acetyltransferase
MAMDADLLSLVKGYVHARGLIGSRISPAPYGVFVAYAPGSKQVAEHFAVKGRPVDEPLQRDVWLTVLDPDLGPADPPPEGQVLVSSEYFMAAPLPPPDAPLAYPVEELTTARALAELEADSTYARAPACDGVFHFVVRQEGRIAAAAHYAFGAEGDIVIDRVATHPDFRRRGLGSTLMYGLMAHAHARGATRALLLSTQTGEKLYTAVGFQTLATVAVYAI